MGIVDLWKRAGERQKATKGKYRVISVDICELPVEGDCLVGEYEYLEQAFAVAEMIALDPFQCMYVYDDEGRFLGSGEGDLHGGSHVMMETTEKIQKAEEYAKQKHKGQYRKDGKTPYSKHLDAVVVNLRNLGIKDGAILCAGWLHDVVEDNPKTVRIEEISQKFGPEVASLVGALTKSTRLPEKEREKEYITRLRLASWEAKAIKICDILANLSDLHNLPSPSDRAKQVQKKMLYYKAIKDDLFSNKSLVPKIDETMQEIGLLIKDYGSELSTDE